MFRFIFLFIFLLSVFLPRKLTFSLGARTNSVSPQVETEEDFQKKIAKALEQNMNAEVVYEDILGEGPGAWDDGPLYPHDQVNCIVWIRKIIAETYGEDAREQYEAMNHLRYYFGLQAFSMRKHFTVRWFHFDPGPFEKVKTCQEPGELEIELDIDRFKESLGFRCELYEEDQDEFKVRFVPSSSAIKCADQLEPGFYFLFGVASEKYNEVFGKKSGPMALVHGMILEVQKSGSSWIYHASIDSGRPVREEFSDYVRRMQGRRHLGYQIYRLRKSWSWRKDVPVRPVGSKGTVQCERKLPKRRKSQSF